jgi:hypothetical protein
MGLVMNEVRGLVEGSAAAAQVREFLKERP